MPLLIVLSLATAPVVSPEPPSNGRDRALGLQDAGLLLAGAVGYLGLHKWGGDLALVHWDDPPAGPEFREDSVSTSAIIGAGALLTAFAALEGGRVEAVAMVEAGLVTTAVTNIFKVFIGRPRPDYVDRMSRQYESDAKREEEHADARRSMPSGHSSAAFAFAVQTGRWLHRAGCQRGWPRAARIAGYAVPMVIAAGVAWTRVGDHRHFPSDVLTGAALGTGVAYGLDRWQNGAAPCP